MSAAQNRTRRLFVTVGAQMPFDRLVKAVDEWAAAHPGFQVFAQIGKTSYLPRYIESVEFIQPNEFRERVLRADLIVSHAGMGSILMALQYGKPIMVMPRLGRLQETRNDHQVATALRFKAIAKVAVAMDEGELQSMLDKAGNIGTSAVIAADASNELIATIKQFIHVSMT